MNFPLKRQNKNASQSQSLCNRNKCITLSFLKSTTILFACCLQFPLNFMIFFLALFKVAYVDGWNGNSTRNKQNLWTEQRQTSAQWLLISMFCSRLFFSYIHLRYKSLFFHIVHTSIHAHVSFKASEKEKRVKIQSGFFF